MKRLVLFLLVAFLSVGLFAHGTTESASPSDATKGQKTIEWWDQFLPLAELHRTLWDKAEAETGVPVVYTQYDAAKLKESLMLAYRTGSCPDVFSQVFGNQTKAMYDEGWFSSLSVTKEELPSYIQDSLFEGYTMFDGKVYSFPTMSINHVAPLWYLTNVVSPDQVPHTYEEARKVAKEITKKSGNSVYGFVVPIAFTERMNATFEDMMMASGSPGWIDWNTGAYQYDSPAAQEVFQFFVDLWDDGSILPASINLNMRSARERWAAGEAAFIIDGSWNVGVVKSSFPTVLDYVDVAEPIRKDASSPYWIYKTPPQASFFISSNSDCVKEATQTLMKFMGKDYYIALAENMDQPPLDLSAVAEANVHPSYKKVCDMFAKTMLYRPDPLLRNLDVSKVTTEMRDIHPTPAEIYQGYCSGALTDWKAELKKYNDSMTAERNRAIKKVQDQGYNVSLNDWIFPNFVYGENFSSDKY